MPRTRVPLALARIHASLAVGERLVFSGGGVPEGDEIHLQGRWPLELLVDVVVGAGFEVTSATPRGATSAVVAGVRGRTLADTVGPRMRLLVCGLNPSVYSADRGHGFARPGNRFWPAVVAAGLVDRPHDPGRALVHHGLGMTDLCKRATTASAELTRAEYHDGAARVQRLVRWLRPGAVCFVGLEGWRAAVDRRARAGRQPGGFGGRPAYVLPSTSGLNAHARLPDLVEHFRLAAALAGKGGILLPGGTPEA